MKATGYLQLEPLFPRGDPSKPANDVRIVKLTQNVPRDPTPGALVVKVEILVDPDVFLIPTLETVLEGEPSQIAQAVVPFPVSREGGEEVET